MQVTLIDHMGSDLTVVNAARVSFNKESQRVKNTASYSFVLKLPSLSHGSW